MQPAYFNSQDASWNHVSLDETDRWEIFDVTKLFAFHTYSVKIHQPTNLHTYSKLYTCCRNFHFNSASEIRFTDREILHRTTNSAENIHSKYV